MRHRSRRLKKKLHLGEFQQFGFEVSITLKPNLEIDDLDRFLEAFILDAIEKNELAFGGGIDCGFITTWKRGSVSEAHRSIVENWLNLRQEVASVTLGPLVDAWYSPISKHVYHRLVIAASSPSTEIWLGDDAGHLVQKEIGELTTSLLPGNYVVEFGLGNPTYPIPLAKASQYIQSELEAGPTCPRPILLLTPD